MPSGGSYAVVLQYGYAVKKYQFSRSWDSDNNSEKGSARNFAY